MFRIEFVQTGAATMSQLNGGSFWQRCVSWPLSPTLWIEVNHPDVEFRHYCPQRMSPND